MNVAPSASTPALTGICTIICRTACAFHAAFAFNKIQNSGNPQNPRPSQSKHRPPACHFFEKNRVGTDELEAYRHRYHICFISYEHLKSGNNALQSALTTLDLSEIRIIIATSKQAHALYRKTSAPNASFRPVYRASSSIQKATACPK